MRKKNRQRRGDLIKAVDNNQEIGIEIYRNKQTNKIKLEKTVKHKIIQLWKQGQGKYR